MNEVDAADLIKQFSASGYYSPPSMSFLQPAQNIVPLEDDPGTGLGCQMTPNDAPIVICEAPSIQQFYFSPFAGDLYTGYSGDTGFYAQQPVMTYNQLQAALWSSSDLDTSVRSTVFNIYVNSARIVNGVSQVANVNNWNAAQITPHNPAAGNILTGMHELASAANTCIKTAASAVALNAGVRAMIKGDEVLSKLPAAGLLGLAGVGVYAASEAASNITGCIEAVGNKMTANEAAALNDLSKSLASSLTAYASMYGGGAGS